MMRQDLGLPTNLFYGLPIYSGTKQGVIDFATHFLEETSREGERFVTIFTPNPEQLVLSRQNPRFYQVLQTADILLPDGAGLVWAANRRQTTDNRLQRIPGREVFHDLLDLAIQKHYRVFLLGGRGGSAQLLITNHQSLVASYDDGPRENEAEILEKIRQARPALLFVAYGAPYQEEWILNHREALVHAGVKIAMVVGGAFEYEAGMVPKVPQVIQDFHLEWLHRLISQPWRWKRQLKGARFFLDVVLGKYS